jgi:hypothetical protein
MRDLRPANSLQVRFARGKRRVLVVLCVVGSACGKPHQQTSVLPFHTTRATTEVDTLPFDVGATIAWYDSASIVVVDNADQRIVVADTLGRPLRAFGGKGSGPGEARSIMQIWSDGAGRVVTADPTLMRVTEYNTDGEYVRSQQIPGFPLRLLGVHGDTVNLAWLSPESAQQPVVGEVNLGGAPPHDRYSLFDVAPMLIQRPHESLPPNPFVAAVGYGPRAVVFGEGMTYTLVKMSMDGRVLQSFGRPELPPQMPSPADLARMRDITRKMNATVDPEVARQVEPLLEDMKKRPKPHFAATALATDSAGRLWVLTSRGNGDSTFVDVFDPAGTFIGTVVLRDHVEAVAIRGDRLAAIVERRTAPLEGLEGVDFYHIGTR